MRTYDLKEIPDVQFYYDGLKKMDSMNQLLPLHKLIFKTQYNSPNHTATAMEIKDALGLKTHTVVNLLYGELGHAFCEIMNYKPEVQPYSKFIWWSIWSKGYSIKGKGFYWEMRPEVCKALEMLGWVQGEPLPEKEFLEKQETQITESKKRSEAERQNRIATAPTLAKPVQVVTTMFQRNTDVIASTLYRANGKCELCESPAPFLRESDNSPYLEVHHIMPISDGGEDTLRNTVTLCPNCHRRMHYGKDKENLNKKIHFNIQRRQGSR